MRLFEGTERRHSKKLLDMYFIFPSPSALHKPNIYHLGTTQIFEGGMKVMESIFSRSIFLHLKLRVNS